jgi:hypothetical protein
MNVEIFSICDAATDTGGKLNLLGAFDTIGCVSFPLMHPLCAVAMRLRFTGIEEGQHRITIHLVDEDGRMILPPLDAGISACVPEGQHSAAVNLIVNIQGLKIEKPGEYSVNLAIDGRQESSIPVFARQVEKP